jgi:hypothetical protein
MTYWEYLLYLRSKEPDDWLRLTPEEQLEFALIGTAIERLIGELLTGGTAIRNQLVTGNYDEELDARIEELTVEGGQDLYLELKAVQLRASNEQLKAYLAMVENLIDAVKMENEIWRRIWEAKRRPAKPGGAGIGFSVPGAFGQTLEPPSDAADWWKTL